MKSVKANSLRHQNSEQNNKTYWFKTLKVKENAGKKRQESSLRRARRLKWLYPVRSGAGSRGCRAVCPFPSLSPLRAAGRLSSRADTTNNALSLPGLSAACQREREHTWRVKATMTGGFPLTGVKERTFNNYIIPAWMNEWMNSDVHTQITPLHNLSVFFRYLHERSKSKGFPLIFWCLQSKVQNKPIFVDLGKVKSNENMQCLFDIWTKERRTCKK